MPVKKNQRSKIKDQNKGSVIELSVPAYSIAGIESGKVSLPKEVFGGKVNKALLSQAVRIYSTNEKTITASTKTRGEVRGSTIKIYRQKGTGRARHGAVRAPIFVGGGIVFGPKPRKVELDLPKKMKKAALLSALAAKAVEKNVIALTDPEKVSGKTKEVAKFLYQVSGIKYKGENKKNKKMSSALIITDKKMDNLLRAAKNIANVTVLPSNLVNVYEVLKHEMLVLTKEAVEKLEFRIKNLELRIENKEGSKKTEVVAKTRTKSVQKNK